MPFWKRQSNEPVTQAWRTVVSRLCPRATFGSPADPVRLVEAERRLGVPLPGELTSLLLEPDGVRDERDCDMVWPLARIVADNEAQRHEPAFALYMPVDNLLFFADAGDGELFGYGIARSGEVRESVFIWDPITDSRTRVADSLGDWLERWFGGTMKV